MGETAFRFGDLVIPATAKTLAEAVANVRTNPPRTETAGAMAGYDWAVAAAGIVKIARDVVHRG